MNRDAALRSPALMPSSFLWPARLGPLMLSAALHVPSLLAAPSDPGRGPEPSTRAMSARQAAEAAGEIPGLSAGAAAGAGLSAGNAALQAPAGVWFDGRTRRTYPLSRLQQLEPSLLLTIDPGKLEGIQKAVQALGHRLETTRISGVLLLHLSVNGAPSGPGVAVPGEASNPLQASLQLEGVAGIVAIELNRRLLLRKP